MYWLRQRVGHAMARIPVEKVMGKERPRFDHRSGRTYTPSKTARAEREIRRAWAEQVGEAWAGFDGIVTLEVISTRELPRSSPKYLAGSADTKRPDADNILKLVCDALIGTAFADDSQLTDMRVTKVPRTPYGTGNTLEIRTTYYREERI